MGFSVEPAKLRELAGLLDRARTDIEATRTYLAKMESFEGGEGLLGLCLDGHRAAYQTLAGWLKDLEDPTLAGTSAAVSESADYYQRTDAASARELDSTYPKTDVFDAREKANDPIIDSGGIGHFADLAEPTDHLTEPKDYSYEMYGGDQPSFTDYFSLTSILCGAIQGVSKVAVWLGWLDKPYNPITELAEKFVGDWAGARQAADILRNVGTAVGYTATNIRWASQCSENYWQGNAGDGAAVYLMNLGKDTGFESSWPPIDQLAGDYEKASAEMVRLREAAKGTLESIFDAALTAAGACGVAGGALATGVGAPIAGIAALLAGAEIAAVVNGINKLISFVGELETVTHMLKAAQGRFASISSPQLPTLPKPPVNLPKVGVR